MTPLQARILRLLPPRHPGRRQREIEQALLRDGGPKPTRSQVRDAIRRLAGDDLVVWTVHVEPRGRMTCTYRRYWRPIEEIPVDHVRRRNQAQFASGLLH